MKNRFLCIQQKKCNRLFRFSYSQSVTKYNTGPYIVLLCFLDYKLKQSLPTLNADKQKLLKNADAYTVFFY